MSDQGNHELIKQGGASEENAASYKPEKNETEQLRIISLHFSWLFQLLILSLGVPL